MKEGLFHFASVEIQKKIAWLALIGICLHVILYFSSTPFASFAQWPLYVVLGFGGVPLVLDLLRKMVQREFGADLIAGISIITSMFLHQYLAGSFVVLMLSGGQAIEEYAMRTASKVLEALSKRAPTVAHKKEGDAIREIPIHEVAIGDLLQLFPHETCPVDGSVVTGHGVVDESYLTGEPFLISKAPGASLLSGSINGDFSLTFQATKKAEDSRYAKIMQVMSETQQKRPYMRRMADQLGAWFTPLAVGIALLAYYFSGDPTRFLAVLVIATPCPLLIAIPVAIIGSISLCANRGILIKNPVVLEQFSQCRTMIFDKTGTLTYGKPLLTEQVLYAPYQKDQVLQWVASIERYSKHPLSQAIQEKANEQKLSLLEAEEIQEKQGEGLVGKIQGHVIEVTSRKRLIALGMQHNAEQLPIGKGLECVILVDRHLAAYYRFHDMPRVESASFVKHLPLHHSIRKIILLSGDRAEEVNYLATQMGIREVYAGKSPEEKVEIVVGETAQAKTAYLGDGINDAPALLAANVGIGFGTNSDITSEAAGAVIMDQSIQRVDEFLHISQRMRSIALQSALGGIGLSLIGMLFAAWGFIPPVAGAMLQECIDVVVVFNALRTIWPPQQLADLEG